MACNCKGKNKSNPQAKPLAVIGEGASLRRISTVRRPFRRIVYFVVAPDGSEEKVTTLAEAQNLVRRGGPGYSIRSERPE
jgi:hypothetical protein